MLRPWLAALCLVGSLAAAQALLLPRWPRASELVAAPFTAALRQGGWNPKPRPGQPAKRSAELSMSRLLAWRLSGGEELSLVDAVVRQRDSFQTAFIARDRPSLKLSQRRRDWPIAGTDAGLIAGRPALQTCLVRQKSSAPIAASSRDALGRAADQRVSSRSETLKGLLGLQPSRHFGCVLVTLRSASARPLPADRWQPLLSTLQSVLERQASR